MTHEEMIAMAQEAKIVVTGDAVWKLCELVVVAERERCAKIVEQYTGAWDDEGFSLAAKIRKGE